ncbi:protein WHAT'S THIS FACTOR 1, chloroplastic [Nicotiana sylvestris]|uniref:Protein ROOT PRIMORDIUM DEFECTIVE 1 n=1 Tax=Nicotiana sylvestris TaxID=4096 RepID=A0A1U7V2Y7_NICSY|nr:PREDICTED: protein ROOT PRIMORDIUM DEFECTIVE 1 [Nicotiana sylvestris]XP_016512224.1 PREDICTED: protein ROOT PRIMORDIUM DEFECTIVE 1-like [Nicotiana tabacum]
MQMMLTFPVKIQLQSNKCTFPLHSDFLPGKSRDHYFSKSSKFPNKNTISVSTSITCSNPGPHKLVRDRKLDKHVVKNNNIRFVQKLKTLLLSKPKHFMPINVLSKCRGYLTLSKPRSILSMIHRYPTIFELFTIPTPPTPFNATKPLSQLCVRLTPAAAALFRKELELKSAVSVLLAAKLQKLLMLTTHHRLLLSKLVHIAPDLGLPINFHSRLCNEYPDKFRVVDTSYGRALELVSCDPALANALPSRAVDRVSLGLIVDRPLKFKHLKLRRGLNLKRRHEEYLIMFKELPDVCPYKTKVKDFYKESINAEKRACAVAREVLGMMVEKRTLVDHLTHFRKEFGLPNKLRAMLIRHPELFYVSVKGQRDSVFLVEGYNDRGKLLEKDEMLVIKDQLMKLVREGKRMRRERRKAFAKGGMNEYCKNRHDDDEVEDDTYFEQFDGLDELFEYENSNSEKGIDDDDDDDDDGGGGDLGSKDGSDYDESIELWAIQDETQFWTTEAHTCMQNDNAGSSGPW